MSNPYYGLPADDLALTATAVTASAEDADYPAANLITENPAQPAKLTTTSGTWVLQFSGAIAPVMAALLYHNLDAALAVTLQANTSDSWGAPPFSQAFTIPAHFDPYRTTVSPFILLTGSPSYAFWRLNVSGTNSLSVDVGRLMLIGTLREFERHVKWGLHEDDEHPDIVLPTELDVETIYPLGGFRRMLNGELFLEDAGTTALRTLRRSVQGRTIPWLLIPFPELNDAWIVRFVENRGRRTYEAPDPTTPATLFAGSMPFAVREHARGVPFP